MKTNKEVIHKLKKYFLEQETEVVALALAGLMIDANRWDKYDKLSENEARSLHHRTHMHALSVQGFINGDRTKMKVSRLNSDEEEI